MGRWLIRHEGSPGFDPAQCEPSIFDAFGHPRVSKGGKNAHRRRIVSVRPLLGAGSGRAGGGRMHIHLRDHVRWVGDTAVGSCPICRYRMRIFQLWRKGHMGTKLWRNAWEGRDAAREECERFLSSTDCIQYGIPEKK